MSRHRLVAALPAAALALALATPGSAAPWHGHGHHHGPGHHGDGNAWQGKPGRHGGGAARGETPEAGTVSVTGQGESSAAPDIAVVTVGVTVQAPSAAEAMRQNTERQQVIIDTLKTRGIEPRDIQTSGLNLNPVQDYSREGKPPVVTGYQATNLVTVRVRQLPLLGEALDALVGAGANEINGISFQREKMTEAENEARARAVENAQLRAQIIANAAGMDLGRLLSIADQSGRQGPQPMMRAMAMDSAKESAVPVEAGELSVAAEVSVTWELRPMRRGGMDAEGRKGRDRDRQWNDPARQGDRGDHARQGSDSRKGMQHRDGDRDQSDRSARPESGEPLNSEKRDAPGAGASAVPVMPPPAAGANEAPAAAASAIEGDAPAEAVTPQPTEAPKSSGTEGVPGDMPPPGNAAPLSAAPATDGAAQDGTAPEAGEPAIPAPAN